MNNQLVQEYVSETERYRFKIREEKWLGVQSMIYDHVRDNNKDEKANTKTQNADVIIFKVHNVKGNRARRRYDKSPWFSKQAVLFPLIVGAMSFAFAGIVNTGSSLL